MPSDLTIDTLAPSCITNNWVAFSSGEPLTVMLPLITIAVSWVLRIMYCSRDKANEPKLKAKKKMPPQKPSERITKLPDVIYPTIHNKPISRNEIHNMPQPFSENISAKLCHQLLRNIEESGF